MNTYRFCDNVWTFVLNDVEFREVGDLVKVDKVKVVACDGKGWYTCMIITLRYNTERSVLSNGLHKNHRKIGNAAGARLVSISN